MSNYLPTAEGALPLEWASRKPSIGDGIGRGVQEVLPWQRDPLHWTNADVLHWLRYTFQQKRSKVYASDLEFYFRFHVHQDRECLTGRDLYRMTYTDFVFRFGNSAAIIFEEFLHRLSEAGYGSHDLLTVWQRIKTFRTQQELDGWKSRALLASMSEDESSSDECYPRSPRTPVRRNCCFDP